MNSCLSPDSSTANNRNPPSHQTKKTAVFSDPILDLGPCRSAAIEWLVLMIMINMILNQRDSLLTMDKGMLRSKKLMKIVFKRLKPNKMNWLLTRLNLMPTIVLTQLMLLTKPPLKLQQQRKLSKSLNTQESSTHSMALSMKTMALATTRATVSKLVESTNF